MADAPIPEKNQGNFFAVDRRAWSHVCALGSMSAAVAYLVLARGTQGDMRTTSWSVNAIEDRTAIPRLRAKRTIEALIEGQVIEKRKGGTKPQYYLLPPAAIENRRNPAQALTPEEEQVLAVIAAHPGGIEVPTGSRRKEPWPFGSPQTVVNRLCEKGRARYVAGAWSKVVPVEQPTASIDSDWIWLPNTIVDGADGEVPPLERVRQSQNLAALRLFVDLYHAQSLATDGGVHWRQVRQDFDRRKVGEWGSYVVWAFWPGNKTAWSNMPFVQPHMTGQEEKVERADGTHYKRDAGWPAFWAAMGVLTSTGLVEFVPHVVDADSDEGTVLHPLADVGQGEEVEREVTVAARGAGLAMLNAAQLEWATTHSVHIVPIQTHISEVQVVGLARLRHRAKTTATASWFERMGEWSEQATRYRDLEASAAGLAPGQAA